VSVLDEEYTKATLTLGSTIQQYAAIDLYNPERARVTAFTRVTPTHDCSRADTTTHDSLLAHDSTRAIVDDALPCCAAYFSDQERRQQMVRSYVHSLKDPTRTP